MFILEGLEEATHNFEILPFQSSEAFIEFIGTTTLLPVLVVMDYNMPKWNAEDILIKIKSTERLAFVKTFILSTGMSPELKQRLLSLGAYCCIPKPDSMDGYKIIAHDIIKIATTIQQDAKLVSG